MRFGSRGPDTSLKCLDREGLGRRRTGTRQKWTDGGSQRRPFVLTSLLTVNIPFEGGTLQWNPALTKCHGTEKIVLLGGGIFVVAKTPI